MSSATAINLAIGLIVLAFVLYRQLAVRRVRENYRLVIVLAILGVIEFSRFLSSNHPASDSKIVVTLACSAILAAGMGVLRARTVKVWRGEGGQLLRRGTWLTAVLWIIAVAAHLGLDTLIAGGGLSGPGEKIGDATILLYLAVSFGVQQAVLLNRAQRLELGDAIPAGGPTPPSTDR